MQTSIENYKKLKKKFIDNLFFNEISQEQKIIGKKESELKNLRELAFKKEIKNSNRDLNNVRDIGKSVSKDEEFYNLDDIPNYDENDENV